MADPIATAGGHGSLGRAPSGALVVGAIASVQFGAALAATLFDRVGSAARCCCAWSRRRSCCWRCGGRGCAAARRRELLLAARVRARARRDEPQLLRGDRAHPARHRRRDRVRRAARPSRWRARAGALDLLWVGLAAARHPRADARRRARRWTRLGVAFALRRRRACGAPTSCSTPASGGRSTGSTGLTLAMCVAAVVALPLGVADGGSAAARIRSRSRIGSAVGVLSSAIPYSFEVEALRRIAAARVRRADEPRAGRRGARRLHRARPDAGSARARWDRSRHRRLARRVAYSAGGCDRRVSAVVGRAACRAPHPTGAVASTNTCSMTPTRRLAR